MPAYVLFICSDNLYTDFFQQCLWQQDNPAPVYSLEKTDFINNKEVPGIYFATLKNPLPAVCGIRKCLVKAVFWCLGEGGAVLGRGDAEHLLEGLAEVEGVRISHSNTYRLNCGIWFT